MTDRIIIRGGYVLSMSDYTANDGRADVLIAAGRIQAIGPDLVSEDATAIDATGSIVLPGLIDSHRHLWYTPLRAEGMDHALGDLAKGLWPKVGGRITADDIYVATRAGIVDALNMGITTVLDYCHAVNTDEHATRALEAHLELPGRALFGYGPSIAQKMKELSGVRPSTDWKHARRAQDLLRDSDRISLALAVQGPAASGRAGFEHDLATARSMGVPITAHIASAAGGAPNGEIASLDEWGLLGPDMHFSHCTGSSDDDFAKLKAASVHVTASPIAEWLLGMGMPALTRMHRAGLRPAIGADAVCSSTGDLFEEARAGLMAARSVAADEIIAGGAPVVAGGQLEMTAMDAVASITTRAAAAVFMSDAVGSLEIGKRADVIVVSDRGLAPATPQEAAAALIGAAAASDVSDVVVDGVIVKCKGRLIGIDSASISHALSDTRKTMKSYFG
jgi:5-methylthioadenosine/S-adenosylhomocysteine deaminase